jgi:cytidylate kinase
MGVVTGNAGEHPGAEHADAGHADAERVDGEQTGVITIDGPAASGKSTVALEVARRLGVPFVSSGLLYRAATRLVLDQGAEPSEEDDVLATLQAHDVRLAPRVDGNRMYVDGRDVTADLHTDAVDTAVSIVAAHPRVRRWVFDELRDLAGPFVVEGRDMGTNVFPGAQAKFYLTASPEERARRRVGERGAALDEIAASIRRRDRLDAKQLAPAADAVHIDTDELAPDEVVAAVLARVAADGEREAP